MKTPQKILKKCAYKGCPSFQASVSGNGEETFFMFPKDPGRYQVWVHYSQCDEKSKLPKYLCSKHFDHRKYISVNQRRKMLLRTAIPYKYEDSDQPEEPCKVEVEEQDEEEEYLQQCVVSTGDGETGVGDEDRHEEQDIETLVSVLTDEGNESSVVHDEQEVEDEPQIVSPKSVAPVEIKRVVLKRKAESPGMQQHKSLRVIKVSQRVHEHMQSNVTPNKATASSSTSLNKSKKPIEKIDSDFSEDEVLQLSDDVCTFNMRGEEYVQMPKHYYMQEKSNFLRQIRNLKRVIANVKSCLEDE